MTSFCLIMILLGCGCEDSQQQRDALTTADPATTRKLVIAFSDNEALSRFRMSSFEGMQFGVPRKGFRRVDTIVEIDVTSRLSTEEILKQFRGQTGVTAAYEVASHRFSLVVVFKRSMRAEEAAKELKNFKILLVRSPGKKPTSSYFEVITESSEELGELLSKVNRVESVDIAELNFEYTID